MTRSTRNRQRGDGALRTGRPRSAADPASSAAAASAPAVWIVFAAVVLCAFGLRLAYILQARSDPTFAHPKLDAQYHDQWAQAIAAGQTFNNGPYFRAPLYPAFLAGVYKVFGHGYLAPRVIQAILGSLSCGLVVLIGCRVFGRAIGAVAGFAAASYWILIYYDSELHMPALIAFLDLLLILLLLRAARSPGKVAYAAAGVVLGLSAIARPDILPLAPAIVLWLLLVHRAQIRRALLYVVCLTVGCLAVVLPIAVRNYVVGKDLVLIASQGGVNFYIGNNPASDGHTAIVPGTPGDWWGGYHAAIDRAEKAAGRPLKPSEVSRYYFRQALAFMASHPGQALTQMGRKLWLFWNSREISNNRGIYFWTERFTPLLLWLPLSFALVGPLGILGLFLCWRRGRELFPLWGFVLIYMVVVVAFFCCARFRVPILGPLVLLATFAVFSLVAAVRRARWGELAVQLAVLVPAALLVNLVPAYGESRNDAQDLRKLGLVYREQDRRDLALQCFNEAVQASPDWLLARCDLGLTLSELGRNDEAIEQYDTGLKRAAHQQVGQTPADVAAVHSALGNLLAQRGEYEDAIWHYHQALALAPQAQTYLALGVALHKSVQTSEAMAAYHDAIALDPDCRDAHMNLARLLAWSGQPDEAAVHYREVLRIRPGDAEAAEALRSLGRSRP